VITRDAQVSVNACFKHSRIKQYLKDGRALRIETVINSANDLGRQRRLPNLEELQTKACAANTRLLDTERVGQGCVLPAQPSSGWRGRRLAPTAGRPQHYGLATLGSWPWSAPCARA
jgi:hypothetical protein